MWRLDGLPAFLTRTIIAVCLGSIGVFIAVRAAVARDGVTGRARSFVTVAGTLSGPGITPGARPVVTFEFLRSEDGGAPSVACRSSVAVAVGADGTFSEAIPLHAGAPACPDTLFDGRDVLVRALIGGTEVAAPAPINPVPYAHFATQAGTSERLAHGPRFVWDQLDAQFILPPSDAGIAAEAIVPGLSVTLPSAGTYLVIFNGRFFGHGTGTTSSREDLNVVRLMVGDQIIASQSLPGYLGDRSVQRAASVTLVTPYRGVAGDVLRLHMVTNGGSVGLNVGTFENDNARLIAIPMVEGL